ncbi:hypothetical protein OPV22_008555 [Ensete ventricosum]|uniref:Uncharacterized protein n=1 Tax=Ensete ventricosum TaxID=4639 RepID=A0AAV8RDT5_ENSVE|nr:hypothetical protein OPV22_008555 [Ensete ventricosum]
MSHHSITYKSEEEAEGGKSLKQGLRLEGGCPLIKLLSFIQPGAMEPGVEEGGHSHEMRGTAPEVIIEVGWKVNEEDNLVEASDKELLQEVDVPLVVDHEVTDLVQEGDSIWIKEGKGSSKRGRLCIWAIAMGQWARGVVKKGAGDLGYKDHVGLNPRWWEGGGGMGGTESLMNGGTDGVPIALKEFNRVTIHQAPKA